MITYGISLVFGYLLKKYFRMPWMFAAMFLGLCLSSTGLFKSTIESETFQILMNIGMLILLFLLGFNIDLRKTRKLRRYIISGSLLVVVFEGLLVSLILYFLFSEHIGFSFIRALLVALSFATVGEALLPILAELDIVKTIFGQIILGIGALDDILEVLTIIFAAVIRIFEPGVQCCYLPRIEDVLLGSSIIILLALIILKVGRKVMSFLEGNNMPPFVFFILSLLFLFSFAALGYHFYEGLAAAGAIFGGIALRGIIPGEKLHQYESAIEFLGHVFLSPIFFLGVGYAVSLNTILLTPLLIVIISIFTTIAKCLASFLALHKILGTKNSLLAGAGLSVRFSTSLTVQYILLKANLISLNLYSALVTTAILSNPVIVALFSWKLANEKPP